MRLLFYSHDSYGLGHIRRTLSIAEQLLADGEAASGLVLTGAPRAYYFRYPPHCDYVKLPSVTKNAAGSYVSRELDMPLDATIALRRQVIQSAAASFDPDCILVDHTPVGLCGEIRPLLAGVGAATKVPLRVLGMRDILDEPEAVARAWNDDRVLDVMRFAYDKILIYGQRDVFDPIAAYDIPQDIAEKIVFTGYLARSTARTPPGEIVAQFAPETGRLVTVTAGGGGDGLPLMRAALKAYAALGARPGFEMLLVTGPLLSPRKRQRLSSRVAELPGVRMVDYHADLPALYHASSLVVSMAGYNAVCEMACAGTRALLVPRVHPRREQWIRATRLQARGVVRVLAPYELSTESLASALQSGLEAPRPPRRWGLDFSGLVRASRAVHRAIRSRRSGQPDSLSTKEAHS